jgi:folate-binding protein YgfZ
MNFSDLEKECSAARKTCGLFDHPNRGLIEVSGNDRISFLHNILSNNIKNLSPGKGALACLLNAQAKIIAQVNVLCFGQHLWLAVDYPLKDKLLDALNKLIITEDVALKDKSDDLKLISIHGPKSKELLKALFKREPPAETLSHETITMGSVSGVLIRINLTGEMGYGWLVLKNETAQFKSQIEQIGTSFHLSEIHLETLETLRIESGIPRYGVDFDESHIPLEAGLDQTVSFAKGCFPGQEIIARLDSRGGVVRKLSGLILKGEIAPKKGALILKNGADMGLITSAVFSPTLKKTIALGFLKKECWEPGTDLTVEDGGNKIPARVATLPFYAAK